MEGRRNVLFNHTLNTFDVVILVLGTWLKTTQVIREETHCCYMSFSFQLAAKDLLYVPSHIQDNTYHNLYYTSHEELVGTEKTI